MKWKLLWRRLSVSAPHMAVKSRRPWWITMLLWAATIGVAILIARWTFEHRREWSGIDVEQSRAEIARLNEQVEAFRRERDQLAASIDRSKSDAAIADAARDRLTVQIKALERENAKLREELAFFEQIAPVAGPGVSVRSLQVDSENSAQGRRYRYRVLVGQGPKPGRDFVGHLQLVVSLVREGRGVTMTLPNGGADASAFALSFRMFQRLEGSFEIPVDAVVQSVEARVMSGEAVKARHTVALTG
ncbi:MAG TPA: DUF6776 family protein [Burkholderiaceae bacterium]|nr:DUF6776 family protein [Burkholderiaceae bacterium]